MNVDCPTGHNCLFSEKLFELSDEITRLRADLAAVTEERDRLQIMHDEAYISGMKHGWNCCAAREEERYKNSIENIREQIRRARAALEGVKEPLATHKEPDERLNLRNAECLPSTVAVIKSEPLSPKAETEFFVLEEFAFIPLEAWMRLSIAPRTFQTPKEPASPWRDIESAPRDGSVFLAINNRAATYPRPKGYNPYFLCFCLPPDEGVTYVSDAGWREPGRDWPAYPTHWMPLPEPPR